MQTFLSCLLLVFLVATASAQETEQTGWEEFAPEGGGFSMLFPTKPVETITTRNKAPPIKTAARRTVNGSASGLSRPAKTWLAKGTPTPTSMTGSKSASGAVV